MVSAPHKQTRFTLSQLFPWRRAGSLLPFALALAVLAVSSVADTAVAAEQVIKDTFNSDPPGTPLPSHILETDAAGGGWLQSLGADFRITSDGLAASETGINNGPSIAVIDTLTAEYDLTATVTRDVKSSTVGLVFRYVDEQNYFVARHDGQTAELVKVVNGTEQVLDSEALPPVGIMSGVATIQVRENEVIALLEGVSQTLHAADTTFNTATRAGLYFTSRQTTSFRDFEVNALAPSPGPGPAEDLPEPVVADSFTAEDGIRLPEHSEAGQWQEVRGQWAVTGGQARLSQPADEAPFADQVAAIGTAGLGDPDISADITWHGGTAGLAWDVLDASNYSITFWDGFFLVAGRVEGGIFRERGRQRIEWSPGQTRSLRVQVNGGNTRVYLDNDIPVMLAIGLGAGSSGNAGIFVRVGELNSFDNFTVRPSLPLSYPDPVLPAPPPFTDPGAPMTANARVFDSFGSANATLLQDRQPEIDPSGSGWTAVSGLWQVWEAQASEQSGVFDYGASDRFAVIDTGRDEYELKTEIEWDGGRAGVLFGGRVSSAGDAGRNGFLFWRDGDRLELGKLIGGVYFPLQEQTGLNWPKGERRTMRVVVEDGTAELSLSGETVFAFSDPDLAFATWAGIFQRGRNDERFDNFTVAPPGSAGDPENGQQIPLDSLFLRGDAAMAGNRLRLTPDELWKGGAAWIEARQHVADGFAATFTFELERGDGETGYTGADGLAFVIQDSPVGVEAIGLPGAGLGYELIENSLAVEFDTWANSFAGESGVHIAAHSGGAGPNGPEETHRLALTELGSLAANSLHTARVVYEPGLLRVFLDDFSTPALEVSVDLSTLLDLPEGEAWAGFTAGTGGMSQTHDVLEFYFRPGE